MNARQSWQSAHACPKDTASRFKHEQLRTATSFSPDDTDTASTEDESWTKLNDAHRVTITDMVALFLHKVTVRARCIQCILTGGASTCRPLTPRDSHPRGKHLSPGSHRARDEPRSDSPSLRTGTSRIFKMFEKIMACARQGELFVCF